MPTDDLSAAAEAYANQECADSQDPIEWDHAHDDFLAGAVWAFEDTQVRVEKLLAEFREFLDERIERGHIRAGTGCCLRDRIEWVATAVRARAASEEIK